MNMSYCKAWSLVDEMNKLARRRSARRSAITPGLRAYS
jgi:molybdenum-dependent DNA-binding transcriptional regulator ModE